jgi:membrane protein YqaA with SNARE-associated domain
MKIKLTSRLFYKVLLVMLILFAALWLANSALESQKVLDYVSQYGYAGIFATSIVSGFNVVVPIPIVAFFEVFMESGLNFWFVILLITIGMTIGDGVGYLIGNASRDVAIFDKHSATVAKLQKFHDRNNLMPLGVMFLYASLAPLPNEIVVIPLAFLKYSARDVLAVVFAGNFIFNLLGALGVIGLFNAFM